MTEDHTKDCVCRKLDRQDLIMKCIAGKRCIATKPKPHPNHFLPVEPHPKEVMVAVIVDYVGGMSMRAIRIKHGVDYAYIYRKLARLGIHVRSRSEAQLQRSRDRKIAVNGQGRKLIPYAGKE